MSDGDTSIALLLRRAALASGRVIPDPEAQIGWADLCLAHGETDAARLLHASAFIRQGFSAELRARQAGIAAASGLWPDERPPAGNRPDAGSTIERAIDELRALAVAVAQPIAAAMAHGPAIDGPATSGADADFAGAVEAVARFLRTPTPSDWRAGEAALAALGAIVERSAAFDPRVLAGAPLPLLATALAFAGLKDFFGTHHDLIAGPFGSAALLHHTARLGSAGLGPYLGNVRQVVRRSRDIFQLAAIARDTSLDAGVVVNRDTWLILLSRELTGGLLHEFIDDVGDLGDAGAIATLATIFDRVARLPERRIDLGLVLRLRDTALDNLDYGLAARAQSLVARLLPGDPAQQVILGTIEASGGRIAAAEQAFVAALAIDPAAADVTDRLVALRTHTFQPYRIDRGYHSPQDRLLTRLHRRRGDTRPVAPQRTYPVAVEL